MLGFAAKAELPDEGAGQQRCENTGSRGDGWWLQHPRLGARRSAKPAPHRFDENAPGGPGVGCGRPKRERPLVVGGRCARARHQQHRTTSGNEQGRRVLRVLTQNRRAPRGALWLMNHDGLVERASLERLRAAQPADGVVNIGTEPGLIARGRGGLASPPCDTAVSPVHAELPPCLLGDFVVSWHRAAGSDPAAALSFAQP